MKFTLSSAIVLLAVAAVMTILGASLYSNAQSHLENEEEYYFASRAAARAAIEQGDLEAAKRHVWTVGVHRESVDVARAGFGPAKIMFFGSGAAYIVAIGLFVVALRRKRRGSVAQLASSPIRPDGPC